MVKKELLEALRGEVERYAPNCAESVVRNTHMNCYNEDVPIVAAEVGPWLQGFVERFAEGYAGSMMLRDVVDGLVTTARSWRTEPGLTNSDQNTRNAIVVDFVNYVAGRRGMDLALYTTDLTRARA